jgi:hypothetical protein
LKLLKGADFIFCVWIVAILALFLNFPDLLNSDNITSYGFSLDVWRGLNPFQRWYLAPAPALFSEVLLFLPLSFFKVDPFQSLVGVSIAQALVLFLILSALTRKMGGGGAQIFLLRFFFVLTTLASVYSGSAWWLYAVRSNMHMGALLFSLVSYFLFFEKKESEFPVVLSIFLQTIAILDDRLYFVSFTVPCFSEAAIILPACLI